MQAKVTKTFVSTEKLIPSECVPHTTPCLKLNLRHKMGLVNGALLFLASKNAE
jgi:hypothetical protein